MKTLFFLFRSLGFVAKNLIRLILLISVYLFRFIAWASALVADAATWGCIQLGVFTRPAEYNDEPTFDPKFTREEIEKMSEKVDAKNMTIKEIQNHYNISYRQARKIYMSAHASPTIHNFALAA